MISNLVIRWFPQDEPPDPGALHLACVRCGDPLEYEIGPTVFEIYSWIAYVCDRCTAREDPDLAAQLWRLRAELDRCHLGPHTRAWLDTIEPDRGADIVRREVETWYANGCHKEPT